MQHTGVLFLGNVPAEVSQVEGQFALTLVLLDNMGARGKEPYRVRWTGAEAQAFWHDHQADLKPGAIVEVELQHLRAHPGIRVPELRAIAKRLKVLPKRSPEERQQLSKQEQPGQRATAAA